MSFTLPELGYKYDALEPYIDAKTMEIHHSKHHAAYVEKLNAALEKYSDWQSKSIEQILQDIKNVPQDAQTAVQNNGGGHANHAMFWQTMKPGGSKQPVGKIAEIIDNNFGNFKEFKIRFTDAALTQFGSGWAWLVKSGEQYGIYSTANQDSPLMEDKIPLLGLDVWEHAYYLNYQNRRPEYVEAFWNVINWDEVEARLA